ncbi:MAG: ABC transporter ATP-binding protein [Alphaproteobacteria bacterium]
MVSELIVADVESFYGSIQALSGVSLRVGSGEIVTLIGANGAGKSTLLMTICGVVRARAGEVIFDGENISRLSTPQIMRRGIAISPEGRRIFSRLTVYENLLMGSLGSTLEERLGLFDRVFDLFPRLSERRTQRGGTLSGGEQQMLAIGRALVSRPRLLLLDEPSLGLAPLVVKQIFSAIRTINESEGTTILLVEQNAHHALRLADRGYVMVSGRIEMSGTGSELLGDAGVRRAYLEGAGAA